MIDRDTLKNNTLYWETSNSYSQSQQSNPANQEMYHVSTEPVRRLSKIGVKQIQENLLHFFSQVALSKP